MTYSNSRSSTQIDFESRCLKNKQYSQTSEKNRFKKCSGYRYRYSAMNSSGYRYRYRKIVANTVAATQKVWYKLAMDSFDLRGCLGQPQVAHDLFAHLNCTHVKFQPLRCILFAVLTLCFVLSNFAF